ncbi:MAG: hypothetical protein GQ576_01135 [Methanococcoides sp.]|nr:hypothetical protein [Methanococcoides sp.]
MFFLDDIGTIGTDIYSHLIFPLILIFAGLLEKVLGVHFREKISSRKTVKAKNKNKNLWVKLLRENEQLDDYLGRYNNIQKNQNLKGSNSYPLVASILFICLYILLLATLSSKFEFWTYMAYISLSLNVLSFFATILIMRYMYIKLRDYNKIYKKSSHIVNLIYSTKFFVILSNGLHLFLLYLIYKTGNYPFNEEINFLILIFEMSFALAIVSFYFMIVTKKDFRFFVKEEINEKIMKNCPPIKITTKESEIIGNIMEIFNDEIIMLNDNGNKNIRKWDEITGFSFNNNDGLSFEEFISCFY